MPDVVKPEFGQLLFGNAFGRFSLGDHEPFVADQLYALSEMLGRRNPDAQAHGALGGEWGYGQDFKNDVFEMHPYWWGDCACNHLSDTMTEAEMDTFWTEHGPECRELMPNFRYGSVEVRWYKYIGRGMSLESDHEVSRVEWEEIFEKCRLSLATPTPTEAP